MNISDKISRIGKLAATVEVQPASVFTPRQVSDLLLQAAGGLQQHMASPEKLNTLFPTVTGFIDRSFNSVLGKLHIKDGQVGLLLNHPENSWNHVFASVEELTSLMAAHEQRGVNFESAFNRLLDETIRALSGKAASV